MKKVLSIFLALIMVISLSACNSSQNEEAEEPTTQSVEETNEDNDENIDEKEEDIDPASDEKEELEEETEDEDQEVVMEEKEVNIYYTSEEYIAMGDEDMDKLAPEKRTVTYGDISLEEAVVKELLTDPKKEKLMNSIPDQVELLEVKVDGDTVYVDFSKNGMQGGSLAEILTIDQIVKSLLNLGTVDKVQFLLDGEVPDTLMGHIATKEPFTTVIE